MLSTQPHWRALGESAASLDIQDSVANADYILQRSAAGLWAEMDGGANAVQNYPVLTAAGTNQLDDITIVGSLDSTPSF